VKITTTCCVGLLMTIGSIAAAQQALPCGEAHIMRVTDWNQFRLVSCRTRLNPYESFLSPTTSLNLALH
jgi:hypothetical protein